MVKIHSCKRRVVWSRVHSCKRRVVWSRVHSCKRRVVWSRVHSCKRRVNSVKCMASRLRSYKTKCRGLRLSDGKTVGGKGRLTDKTIDKVQNLYGQCVRNYVGDLDGMKEAIWIIFGHMICNGNITLEEQHNVCPKGKDSSCKYWFVNTNYDESKRLPAV